MRMRWPDFIRFRSLRGKLVWSLLLLIILPVGFIFYRFYLSSKTILENQLYQSDQYVINRKADEMNEWAVRLISATNLLINDPQTTKYLREPAGYEENYNSFRLMDDLQRKMYSIRDLLLNSKAYVGLLDERGTLLSTWAPLQRQDSPEWNLALLAEETRKEGGMPHWSIHEFPGSDPDENKLLVLSRYYKGELERGHGVILVGIPVKAFFYTEEELMNQREKDTYTLVSTGVGKYFGTMDPLPAELSPLLGTIPKGNEFIPSVKNGEKGFLVHTAEIPQLGWRIVQYTGRKGFEAQLSAEKNRLIGWVALWFLLFAVAFVVLMLRFTKPVKDLVHSMSRVGEGNFDASVDVRGRDEMARLGHHFNKMAEQLKETLARLEAEQETKRMAQFQALQAQIQPHFLLNTLNSIKWMALLSGAEHVTDMLTKLGKLLGYTMRNQENLVTLREELDYLGVYLSLQQIRYNDNLSVHTEVPEELLACRLYKFTLQPLVENSLQYGARFPLHLDIKAEEAEGDLMISLQDNGEGMTEERLREVEARMHQPHAKYSGIGIRNVHERIKMQWGSRYGVRLQSAQGRACGS
ncbi:sensor histidine kinase [Paenibacillus sp. CC-CFT747]|nr:sensor histidine kinase [Paenibacillus sp. CC-CFT747]